jgi:hypothetical protein
VYLGVQFGLEPERTQGKITTLCEELKGRFMGEWHPLTSLMEEPVCDDTLAPQLQYRQVGTMRVVAYAILESQFSKDLLELYLQN